MLPIPDSGNTLAVKSVRAYLVGGAVRDTLLGRSVGDRDFVVIGETPENMLAAGFMPVGGEFPVFLHPKTKEEYALARTEKKHGKGYHGFVFYAAPDVSLKDDLRRRDLTVNAIAQDENGKLIDPWGGINDLTAKVLRHVSPAFSEDPVRLLRVARFAATLPDFSIAADTMALMRHMVQRGEAANLTAERVWRELARGLTAACPARMIEVMNDCGLLEVILPEVAALRGVPERRDYHPEGETYIHTLMVLDAAADLHLSAAECFAALVHDIGKAQTPATILPSHHGHECDRGGTDFDIMVRPLLDVEEQVATAYESRRYQEAMRLLMRATDTINAHVDAAAPWAIAKDTARREELHAVCSAATRAFHLLMLMLTPVLPLLATKAGEFLNTDMHWGEKLHPLAAKHVINKYKHLMQRMDNKQLERLAQSKKTPDKSPPPTKDEPANKSPIAIEDFANMDLRLATITAAEDVTEAQKLLKLTLDVGDTRLRQVFAGIKQHYAAETLVGRQVLYLANLKPRKMRFGESEGMVLAATDGKGDLQLLTAADMPAGAKVS
jgi:methionine--tRNA ligase beta chain